MERHFVVIKPGYSRPIHKQSNWAILGQLLRHKVANNASTIALALVAGLAIGGAF